MKKKWDITPPDKHKQLIWAEKLNLSPITAGVLIKRGWTLDDAAAFLDAEQQDFYDPLYLPNMQAAVARIRAAIHKEELITIFGDYDVDGITATVVLYKTLQSLGANVEYYLPDRQREGYGIHKESITKFIDKTKLLITVDCGIRSSAETEYASNYMDVIITDHHLPGQQLPEAVAVIDPKREDCDYPDKNLAGVGVAFKLCQALWRNIKNEEFTKYLDIVALGTVADIVPLLNENRKFVKMGLSSINNIGLLALINLCGLQKNEITAAHIGFVLGPRLNAVGRLKHASIGVKLLLTEDKDEAAELAQFLDEENKIRQQLVESTFQEASKIVQDNDYDKSAALVVAAENWHPGIIGIVASRLVEKFYRPTIVISFDKEGIGKGSCRSIKNFDICDALADSDDLLVAFGGHSMAAGLTIKRADLNLFREKFTQYAQRTLSTEDFYPLLNVETVLQPEDVTKKLITDISRLEPFGMGNPAPLFLCSEVKTNSIKKIGKDAAHLRFTFSVKNKTYAAIGWRMGEYADKLQNELFHFVFRPGINVWNGKEYIQFEVKDIKIDEGDYPTHDEVGYLYLFLKKMMPLNKNTSKQNIIDVIRQYKQFCQKPITKQKIMYCLKVLSEIGIIKINEKENEIEFLPLPKEKKDINASKTFLQKYRNN